MSAAPLHAAVSIAGARRSLTQMFSAAGLESPDLDARVLVGHALGLDHTAVTAAETQILSNEERRQIADLAARRLAREPVSRIVGVREFWGLPLRIGPAVLDPRADTETLVETASRAVTAEESHDRPLRILDIGTGSGALLLALLSELPHAVGIGTDRSVAALDVARDNARRLGFGNRTHFIACDFGAALAGGFDLVIANPPYVDTATLDGLTPEVRNHDPRLALDGGPDGLAAYRALAADARRLLAETGHMVLELGAGQEAAVVRLFADAGLTAPAPAARDLGGIARALHLRPAAHAWQHEK